MINMIHTLCHYAIAIMNMLASVVDIWFTEQEKYVINVKSIDILQIFSSEMITPCSRGGDLNGCLLLTEAKWIFILGTVSPHGISEELDLSCFIPNPSCYILWYIVLYFLKLFHAFDIFFGLFSWLPPPHMYIATLYVILVLHMPLRLKTTWFLRCEHPIIVLYYYKYC